MLTDIRLSYALLVSQLTVRAVAWMGWVSPLGGGGGDDTRGAWASNWATLSALEQALLWGNLVAASLATAVLLAFYHHTVVVIANRTPVWAAGPLLTYFQVTKPLEMMFRFATAPLRCLPEVCIVGEVRCGTTTLAEHLRAMPGTHGPFCAFHHPLDGKESFYFSGHYFGFVQPYYYRAMFPLRITRWFHRVVLGRPFLVFDGCAQNLTSPFAPELLRAAVGPDLSLLVCLREPVAQNVSWWRYEKMSMRWFDTMGIPQSIHNIGYARVQYPPPTFGASLELSRSKAVSALYAEAEQLPATLPLLNWVVPPQYITWPNGQLSAAARNGGYAANIRRWHRWFTPARFEYFELSEYAVEGGTAAVLRKLHRRLPPSYRDRVSIASIARTVEDRHANANSGGGPTTSIPFPTDAELEDAAAFYAPLNEDLFALLGRRYPSWSNPHPANRSQPQSPR